MQSSINITEKLQQNPHINAYSFYGGVLIPIEKPNFTPLDLLVGINEQKQQLLDNTSRFAAGKSANNVLLWGAKGTGKSSLSKTVMLEQAASSYGHLKIIEFFKHDARFLLPVYLELRNLSTRFIIFCDDIAFSPENDDYRMFKVAMDGGLGGKPENVIMYATSNLRNIVSNATTDSSNNPTDNLNDRLSLVDRFGLKMAFYLPNQDAYLQMVDVYADKFNAKHPHLHAMALEFSLTKGSRNGRTALDFIRSL